MARLRWRSARTARGRAGSPARRAVTAYSTETPGLCAAGFEEKRAIPLGLIGFQSHNSFAWSWLVGPTRCAGHRVVDPREKHRVSVCIDAIAARVRVRVFSRGPGPISGVFRVVCFSLVRHLLFFPTSVMIPKSGGLPSAIFRPFGRDTDPRGTNMCLRSSRFWNEFAMTGKKVRHKRDRCEHR